MGLGYGLNLKMSEEQLYILHVEGRIVHTRHVDHLVDAD